MNQSLISAGDLDLVMASAIATGLLSSVCTIQQPSGTFGPSGAPDGNWANVSGLVNLDCQAAPAGSSFSGHELKLPAEVLTNQPLHVLLDGHYPTITTKMRALIDSVDHDIEAVEHDSQGRMTRLFVTRANI
jgi:hypothetical protein